MRYWFTSDTHFGHWNIVRYCNRPFKSLDEMDETMIKRWNERVKKEDIVFFIGDFCFKGSGKRGEGIKTPSSYWEGRLNGKIIHLQGNHDKNNSTKAIIERLTIRFGGRRIHLVHHPQFADGTYKINFTGHVHEKWQVKRVETKKGSTVCINVGVDVWQFMPVTYEEIMGRYYRWIKKNS